MHENLLPLVSATENDEEITLDRQSAMAFMNCVKKAVLLVGDVSAVLTAQRRAQVLTKLNPSLASLAKDKFPDAGKQLFGDGFEARLKTRSETAQTVAAAHHTEKMLFPMTASRTWRGSHANNQPRQYSPRFQTRFTFNWNPTRFQTPRFQTAGSRGEAKPISQPGSGTLANLMKTRPSLSPGMSLPLIPLRCKFPHSRSIKTLLTKLETYYPGPLGPASCPRPSNRFLETPVQVCPPMPMIISVGNQVLIDIEVQKLASNEAIHLVSPGEGE